MGKKTKVGKGRKDHFYNLAKQQGFRARSAFKLTQLGSKFNLFDDVSFVVDLCAAPGGWMQVARQAIPMAGHVFGVDLCPISPIKGCTGIQADITTLRCERLLNEAMRRIGVPDCKVQLVLHDGAPNVGADWNKDAYVQNDLVLKSLQLACKYLQPHGNFVTKVFRSVDYTKLLFVFSQLFNQVVATKPSSSRDVSAEIFVVCKGFKAPQKIDSALFDASKVFQAVEEGPSKTELVSQALLPAGAKGGLTMGGLTAAMKLVGKKNRSGYDEGDLFRKCTIRQFFESSMPAQVLVLHHKMEFNNADSLDQEIFNHPSTTDVIKQSIRDLKLLGKHDLQQLLKWRLRILKEKAAVAREAAHVEQLAEDERKRQENERARAAMTEAEKALADEQELENMLQSEAREKLKKLRKLRAKFRKISEKSQIAQAVFNAEDDECFPSAAVAAKAFEEEEKEVDAALLQDDTPLVTEEKIQQLQKEVLSDTDDSSSDGEETETGSDVDYVDLLEREMERLHEMEKETAAAHSMAREASKKKELRRERVFKQWAEEMTEFMTDLEQRNKDAHIAVDSDEEAEIDLKEYYGTSKSETKDASPGSDRDETADDSGESTVGDEQSEAAHSHGTDEQSDTAGEQSDIAEEASDAEESPVQVSRKRPLDAGEGDDSLSEIDGSSDEDDPEGINEIAESELPHIPLNDKKLRHERRLKAAVRQEKKEAHKAGKQAKLLGQLGGSVETAAARDTSARASGNGGGIITEYKPVGLPKGPAPGSGSGLPKPTMKKPDSLEEIAEVQALGSLMRHKESRMDLLDGTYNRWAFNDPAELPSWFVEEEAVTRVPDLPMTKEHYQEYRRKLKEINERPIRKVQEARARKRARMDKKLDSIKKQVANIAESAEMNERGKAQAIDKLKRKALKATDKRRGHKVYAVARRNGSAKNCKPKGGQKGSRVIKVDKRLKADKRGNLKGKPKRR